MNKLISIKEKIKKRFKEYSTKGKEIIKKVPFLRNLLIYSLVVVLMFSYMAWQRSRLSLNIIGELPKENGNELSKEGKDSNNNLPELEEIVEKEVETITEERSEKDDETEKGLEGKETEIEREKEVEETIQQKFDIREKIIWPIEGLGEIQGHFKESFNFRDGSHQYILDGILIAAPKGSNVRAVLPGVVEDVVGETSYLYGSVVKISYQDPDGDLWEVYYYNLDNIKVEEGQKVSIGDSIGYVGSNLLSKKFSENHIILEIKKNNVLIDPKPYF